MLQLRRDGVALAYEEAGSGAPPILLVHDLGSDHTCFAPQFDYFRRTHRAVAVDLRGHGQSGKPRQGYTIGLLADDLAWLCYELGLYRPVLLGHGLGAMVALDLAARYRDLPAAIVALDTVALSSAIPLALSQHTPEYAAAPLLRSISSWDHAAATTACVVPVLQLALGSLHCLEVTPDDRREVGLHHPARLCDASRQGSIVTVPVEVNPLVDAFLSGRESRASPG